MDDLIRRQEAIDVLEERLQVSDYSNVALVSELNPSIGYLMRLPSALPSAQPERMRAKWIATTSLQEGQITWRDYKCSNCSHHRRKPMNFCEVCGAKMER